MVLMEHRKAPAFDRWEYSMPYFCSRLHIYRRIHVPLNWTNWFSQWFIPSYPTMFLLGAFSLLYLLFSSVNILSSILVVPMPSFLFALTMGLVCHRLHDHSITFSFQPNFFVHSLIYPANSIRSDGRRQRIRCYGDTPNDLDFGGNKQPLCRYYGDVPSQRRDQNGMLTPPGILLTKYTLLYGRCQCLLFVRERATTM